MNRYLACIVAAAAAIGIVLVWVLAISAAFACPATGPAASWCVIGSIAAAIVVSVIFAAAFVFFLNRCMYGRR